MERLSRDWNILGERNPYGAILTGESGRLAHWDADAFFATGRADVDRFIDALSRIAPDVRRRCALDFGCGVMREVIEHVAVLLSPASNSSAGPLPPQSSTSSATSGATVTKELLCPDVSVRLLV
jgi:hypothetical protein